VEGDGKRGGGMVGPAFPGSAAAAISNHKTKSKTSLNNHK